MKKYLPPLLFLIVFASCRKEMMQAPIAKSQPDSIYFMEDSFSGYGLEVTLIGSYGYIGTYNRSENFRQKEIRLFFEAAVKSLSNSKSSN